MRPSEAAKKPISFNIRHKVYGKLYNFGIDVQYRAYSDDAKPKTGTWYHIKYKGIQLKNFSVPLWGTMVGFANRSAILEEVKNTIDLKASLVEAQIKKIQSAPKSSKSIRPLSKTTSSYTTIPRCGNCGDLMYQAGHTTWHCATCGETDHTG